MRSPDNAAPLAFLGAATFAALGAVAAPAAEPFSFAGGSIRLGGEASGTFSVRDRGFFNYTDYERSNLRLFRLSLSAEVQAGAHLALVGELRTDNLDAPRPYALYLRLRPWTSRSFDVQAGRIPPVFGSYARRRYAQDSFLPGMPLAYQYLTSLRADALPSSADDLYYSQGTGWLVRGYPIGSALPAPGLPLVSAERWDTGVEVRIGSEPVQLAAALTQGTLSRPRVEDDNRGKQLSGRLAWRPVFGLVVGVSAARGEYVTREAASALPAGSRRTFRQQAAGFDAEYAAGYWIVRAEAVWSAWDIPPLAGATNGRLDALGLVVEARYKLAPGLYLAGRADHLGFGRIEAAYGSFPWDAPVTRLEIGGGYSVRRNLLLKGSYQHNSRDGGFVREGDFVAGQVVLWF